MGHAAFEQTTQEHIDVARSLVARSYLIQAAARKLRLQFEGAIYHVSNRGNYRQDVFASVGAAMAFEAI
jgi:hypothetical protein